jgi:drug/metabolite transporter (DMT)-like permease
MRYRIRDTGQEAGRMRATEQSGGMAATPLARESPGVRNSPLWGIGCLAAGVSIFTLQDLIVKLISGAYPVHQILTIRSLVAMPILLALVAFAGGLRTLLSPRAPILLVRGGIMFTAYTAYYLGLAALPLATCVSLYFASPLFITIFSVFLLKEQVGPRRWAAVLFGFLGVVAIVRPGSEIFEWAALLPVYAGLSYGFAQVLARKLGDTESAAVMASYNNLFFLIAGIALTAVLGGGSFADERHASLGFLLRGWATPSAVDLALMIACGIIAAVALTLLTEAYRAAEANIVAPFEYTALVWSVLLGWLFWRELPDAIGWAGMAVIVGAGLYLLRRSSAAGGA